MEISRNAWIRDDERIALWRCDVCREKGGPLLHFLADCGGDEARICLKCIKAKIEEYEEGQADRLTAAHC